MGHYIPQVFWHSSAHILGEAMERVYGGHLCYGPPIEDGFYYDMYTEGSGVSPTDFSGIEDVMKKAVKEKQPFERLEMKKADLLEMFKYNQFKVNCCSIICIFFKLLILWLLVMGCMPESPGDVT